MVEVTIDSIRVSLMSQHRVVILKDVDSDRYLPIWIGPFEADAITIVLQEQEVPRPLTHDLLKNVIQDLGGEVEHIVIAELKNDVFYARIVLEANGRHLEVDARPSDAIALAVRLRVPVYIDEAVMEKAAVHPEAELESEEGASLGKAGAASGEAEEKLDIFKDFLDTLDLDDLSDKPAKTDD
jgi:hypothetical protein